MKLAKIWRSIVVGLSALGVSACAIDVPTAPKVSSDPSLQLSELVTKNALKRNTPLAKDITVSAVIDENGGTLSIPSAGFHLTVPAGAVKAKTRFTVTALEGALVAYEFGPHGMVFSKPLSARQDLSVTEWSEIEVRPLVAGYFAEKSDLDFDNATANVSELINGVVNPLSKQFTYRIEHFSGYVVAW